MARRTPFELERLMGIDAYLTDVDGVGGDLRVDPGDFAVREFPTSSAARRAII